MRANYLIIRELLLIEGLMANGLGNWTAAAEHIGTRTPEETEQHYFETYLNSPNWPLPVRTKPPAFKQ